MRASAFDDGTHHGPTPAIALANGLLDSSFAKTSHGLIRGSDRFRLMAVVDPEHAGKDAGAVLDGQPRGIPVAASVSAAIRAAALPPRVCIVGVATHGGVLPEELYSGLVEAATAGLGLINGLHHLLSEEDELVRLCQQHGGDIVDLRKPRPTRELRFWSGDIYEVAAPRVAVLGTDCALGKRTTCWLLRHACRQRGLRTEMIYTGQTGWLQGLRHGFILDATPNDFVSGELEGAILACQSQCEPQLLLIEGQAALRNPSGPCGAELLLSAAAKGVILQHAPARRWFIDHGEVAEIPPLSEEIELIRLYGSEVWALTLHTEDLDDAAAEQNRQRLADELGLPVFLPLRDGDIDALAQVIEQRLAEGQR